MGWIITGVVFLLFAGLFSLSIAVYVRYSDELTLSVGIAGFRYPILPAPEKKPAETKKKKPAKKQKSSAKKKKKKTAPAEPEEKPKKGDLKGTVDMVLALLQAAFPPLGRMIGKMRLVRVDVSVTVGGEDAAEIAIQYGKICAMFSAGCGMLQNMMKVRLRHVNILCDFLAPQTKQDISFCLKLRLGTILGTVLCIGWRFLIHTIRKEFQKEPAPKPAAPSKNNKKA